MQTLQVVMHPVARRRAAVVTRAQRRAGHTERADGTEIQSSDEDDEGI